MIEASRINNWLFADVYSVFAPTLWLSCI